MSLKTALKVALDEVKEAQFPEVKKIEVGFGTKINETLYILINDGDDEKYFSIGGSAGIPVVKTVVISIIKRLDGKITIDELQAAVEATARKVRIALQQNLLLVSAPYPDSFCLTAQITKGESGLDMDSKSKQAAFFNLYYTGGYWEEQDA